ncbi:MAG: orotate phosphoribosyltransferase [Chloroflexi bacterium HGW-Chloroflexi-10]|nr:MAG: orotate phosphoribosyltransferase [Chloroflexi bacterium HGW-Chloroflexi-10]
MNNPQKPSENEKLPLAFMQRLEARARRIDSLLCVGLDPHEADLPVYSARAARDFCLRLIEATHDLALAYKPNVAFFEVFGAEGWQALKDVIAAVPQDIPVVLDAKRGDISSTAQAYAKAVFEGLGADAVTLNPYLGEDSLTPFLIDAQYGAFALCKTSNPGAGDFQDLLLANGGLLYEQVALKAAEWNRLDNLGLVVGATHPEALARVRSAAPLLWFLTPGVGAQGGELAAALQAGLREDGLGMLVPVSRAISRAENPRKAAEVLVNEMRTIRSGLMVEKSAYADRRGRFAKKLFESGCVRFGSFTLKSGLVSPIYIDLRQLAGYPQLLRDAAGLYTQILRDLPFDCLAGIPYAGLPLVTAVSLQGGWRFIYPRKEVKAYGTQAAVEGVFAPGERIVVIDDLATTGESKFEAFITLKAQGLLVKDVVVLIDRGSGAVEALAAQGYRLHALFTLPELLEIWLGLGLITDEQFQAVREFLALPI